MAHFNKFPTDFPMDELRVMYEYVREPNHGGHDLREVGGCALWVGLYGVGQLPDNHEPIPMGAAVIGETALESFAATVEPYIVMQGDSPPREAFPWQIVLPIVLAIVQELLKRRQ